MKKETLEQAAKQWAYDWGNDSGYNSRTDDLEDGFIAGASWREQQAVSGFSEWWDGYIHADTFTHTAKDAWQASQLSSAKLLAEKDAEIKMLRDLSVKSCVCLKLSDELFKAKELIKEMRKIISISTRIHTEDEAEMIEEDSKEFLKLNAEKIKTILGEE